MSSTPWPPELPADEQSEWLETDGLGGYASGTTLGINTRRYHALLLVALEPPAGRHVLVNDAAVWLERDGQRRALQSLSEGRDDSASGVPSAASAWARKISLIVITPRSSCTSLSTTGSCRVPMAFIRTTARINESCG
jgi:hypothetical protein